MYAKYTCVSLCCHYTHFLPFNRLVCTHFLGALPQRFRRHLLDLHLADGKAHNKQQTVWLMCEHLILFTLWTLSHWSHQVIVERWVTECPNSFSSWTNYLLSTIQDFIPIQSASRTSWTTANRKLITTVEFCANSVRQHVFYLELEKLGVLICD